ncbi:hypothetical protein CYMTET_10592 [Cymbomonas tetramitiformis]|uniref:G-patch domain-containing protein n=1 Tax=Cymbomonas tetramitiformis TaxID=36881 RepID=A0AAE0GNV2_9CHLO|nr:hypothetical protein CYMTET_10592 [Cymbomonas tetramitiformis]
MAPKLAFGFKKSKKPKVAVQLEEEEEEETPVPKKQKTEESTAPVVQATQEPPEAPEDPEVLKVANKLAEYVAKNGRSFEDVAKTRNTEPESPFRFLLDKQSSEYAYYEWKIAECEKILAEERAASVHAEYREAPVAPQGNSASQQGGANFQSSSLTSSVPPWQSATQPPPPPWHREGTSNDHSLPQWQPSQDGERNRQAQLHGCAESELSGNRGYGNQFGMQPREDCYISREQEHYRGYGQRGDHQQEGYHRHDDPRGQSNYDSYYGEHYRSTDTGSRDGGLEAKSEEQYGRDNYQEDHEKTNYDGRDRDRRDQHYGYQGYGGNQVYRERTSGYGGRERSFSESGGRERSFSEKPERRPAASSTPREKSPGRLAAEAAAADGDSMALMNYFTKKAAQQEDARAAKKDPKEMPPLRDELPEKDKNKHVRPAKAPDGKSRTHHMGHYIPEEEMTKFMAKCGSEADKAKAADIDASKRIDSSNKGYALLAKMGWSEGQGLGASAGGMVDPVNGGSHTTEIKDQST